MPTANLDPAPRDLHATGERIETVLEACSSGAPSSPAVARGRAEELVGLVTDLYGSGLERILDLFYEEGHLDEAMLNRLAGDDLVSGLLLVHGLHPHSIGQRVEAALESVRPYLGSHGGDVELIDVRDDGTVKLRLLGSCDGCPSSSVTLKLAVEGAIEAAAPEVHTIEVEEPPSDDGLISVASLRSRLEMDGSAPGRWLPIPELADLADGAVRSVTAGGEALLACRSGADLFAFRNSCARCGSALDEATLGRRLGGAAGQPLLRCPTCGVHYDVRRAGACLDQPELHLDPLPLVFEAGIPSVALPKEAVG
ncbi:MAG: hypothetical protein JWR35_314 [Marmoricola sp.]|jgi:Fe-S cluster biogenesis protein NfuA/nitrite reductase/ring-hydroxylating ferredoxin subunit|nr:hypothetical protein [Marmoricola sp.]